MFSFLLFSAVILSVGCKSKNPEPPGETHGEKEKHGEKDEHGEEGHGGEEHSEGEEKVSLNEEQIRSSGIKIVKAIRQPFGVELEAVGEIASDADRTVQIRTDSPGTVNEVLVAVGDTVDAGQVLLRYQLELDNGDGMKELKALQRGVVVGLYAEQGGHIDPSVPLVTLADTSRLRGVLDVYEKDIAKIRKGQRVRTVVSALPDESFEGKVTYISPRVDEESRTVKVRVDIGNTAGKLKFGMFITGHIQVGSRDAVVLPEQAIQTVEGKPTVFVTEDGKTYVPVHVQLGEISDGKAEIKSGLKGGESVVAQGSFTLKSELSKGEMGEGHSH